MALLITNVHFDKENDRDGAEKDEQDMSKLLISLGYNVEQHTDLSGAVRWASLTHEVSSDLWSCDERR